MRLEIVHDLCDPQITRSRVSLLNAAGIPYRTNHCGAIVAGSTATLCVRATEQPQIASWELIASVVFFTEDGAGCTRDFCSACWMEHKGGVNLTRAFTLEQSLRRRRGGLQNNPFGDGWIEHLMRRRYVEATKELRG